MSDNTDTKNLTDDGTSVDPPEAAQTKTAAQLEKEAKKKAKNEEKAAKFKAKQEKLKAQQAAKQNAQGPDGDVSNSIHCNRIKEKGTARKF